MFHVSHHILIGLKHKKEDYLVTLLPSPRTVEGSVAEGATNEAGRLFSADLRKMTLLPATIAHNVFPMLARWGGRGLEKLFHQLFHHLFFPLGIWIHVFFNDLRDSKGFFGSLCFWRRWKKENPSYLLIVVKILSKSPFFRSFSWFWSSPFTYLLRRSRPMHNPDLFSFFSPSWTGPEAFLMFEWRSSRKFILI